MKIINIKVLFITILFSLFSNLIAKECYFNKAKKVCFSKYFDKSKIYEAKDDEDYYISDNGSIYTFTNIIEVRFNSMGAFFTIVNDYNLKFYDKDKKSKYFFKIDNDEFETTSLEEMFAIVSELNSLKTIMKAQPQKKRKYTKSYMRKKLEEKKRRLEEELERAQERLKHKPKKVNKNLKGKILLNGKK